MFHYLAEGSRLFVRSWKTRLFPKRYGGKAKEICTQIVKECWNGQFFQTSTTNFPQFWTRDFGWCTNSLVQLEFEKEVHQTLRYALNRFKQQGQVTTTITPSGKPFDFPVFAVDSLPWLIHSIKISKFPFYAYKTFLNREIKKFFTAIVNPTTGLVSPEIHFSSIKDLAVRKSSCYDNCMVAMLAREVEEMKLYNPFSGHDYPELITRHFWNGNYFYDDLKKQNYVAGDANLFPFLLGVIRDEEMLRSAIKSIQAAGLDAPFPLKYTATRKNINFILPELLVRNYESHSIWTHLGILYVKLVQKVDAKLAEEYRQRYTQLIAQHQNYPEVLNHKGKKFRTPLYHSDQGMLWAANYLTL